MGLLRAIDRGIDQTLTRLGHKLSTKWFQYICASCGQLTGLFFFASFIAAGFIPPLPPNWSPEQVKEHYINHQFGLHIGAVLMLMSGMTFILYTAEISAQMRRIPGIPWILPAMQLSAGAANVFTFCLPAMVLGVGAYRTDLSPKMVQLMNDMFWLFAVMPFQTFIPVSWSLSYAILIDNREKPLYPKYMAILNFLSPPVFFLGVWVHGVHSGPWAWNGICGFWIPAVFFGSTFAGDTYYLFKAISNQYKDGLEDEDCENLPGLANKINGSGAGPVHLD